MNSHKTIVMIIAILFSLILMIPAVSVNESQASTSIEQNKLIVFMDGDQTYDAAYFGEGYYHYPPDPDHDGREFIGWSLNGEIIDVATFDFNTLPQMYVILHAEYEDAPMKLSKDTTIKVVFIVIDLMILMLLAYWLIRLRHY